MIFERTASVNQNLLAVNMLIYLNHISINRYIKIRGPRSSQDPFFLHRINTAGVKIRTVLKNLMVFNS